MNFTLDLLESVRDEAPAEVVSMVRDAAAQRNHVVVGRAMEDGVPGGMPDDSDTEFVANMLSMSRDKAALGVFRQWAIDAHEGSRERLSCTLGKTLGWAGQRFDEAAQILTEIGADPLYICDEAPRGAAGVVEDITIQRVTVLARAIQTQSSALGVMVERVSSQRDPLPVVAEVSFRGQTHAVNAASFALTLGELGALRSVIDLTMEAAQGNDRIARMALAQTLNFALDSGLTRDCTMEVFQGIAMIISAGADLDVKRIGKRMTEHVVSLSPALTSGEKAPVEYSLSAMLLGASQVKHAQHAISRLVTKYGLDLNADVCPHRPGAKLLHYASAATNKSLVASLIEMGADPTARDANGATPADWSSHAVGFDDAAEAHGDEEPIEESFGVANDHAHDQTPPAWLGDIPDGEPDDPGVTEAEVSADPRFDSLPNVTAETVPSQMAKSLPPNATGAASGTASAPQPAAVDSDPNAVAPSVPEAAATKGAALFARLKATQRETSLRLDAQQSARQKAAEIPAAVIAEKGPRSPGRAGGFAARKG